MMTGVSVPDWSAQNNCPGVQAEHGVPCCAESPPLLHENTLAMASAIAITCALVRYGGIPAEPFIAGGPRSTLSLLIVSVCLCGQDGTTCRARRRNGPRCAHQGLPKKELDYGRTGLHRLHVNRLGEFDIRDIGHHGVAPYTIAAYDDTLGNRGAIHSQHALPLLNTHISGLSVSVEVVVARDVSTPRSGRRPPSSAGGAAD